MTSSAILRALLIILLVLVIPVLSSGGGMANLVGPQMTNVPVMNVRAAQTYGSGNVSIRATYVNMTHGARRVGKLAANKLLRILIALKFRTGTDPESYVLSLYDPSSPNYHQFLTPSSFANMFAPSTSDYDSVVNWLGSQGFTVGETEPDRLIIEASAQARVVEAAFGLDLSVFQRGNMTFYTNTAVATAPATVGSMISSIIGLHNLTFARLASVTRSTADPVYTPANLQAAYDDPHLVSNLGYTGAGQTVDILDFYNYPNLGSDLSHFDTLYSLPNPPLSVILRGSPGACPSSGNFCVETAIDTEWAHAMAPGANLHVILEPSLTATTVTDGVTYVVNTDLTTGGLFTNSYGGPEQCSFLGVPFENGWTSSLIGSLHPLFIQAAAQGISTFYSTGDSGAYDSCGTGSDSILTVEYPASDNYVTAVGGTSLGSLSPRSESAWSCDPGCSTGGVSAYFALPTYQSADGISLGGRGVPDVAADADPFTGISIYCTDPSCPISGLNSGWGGTSLAAPLWAGSVAVLNQALAKKFGFLNPLLYSMYYYGAYSSAGASDFHDITSGNNGHYNAGPGYDLVTGLGSPDLFNSAQNGFGLGGIATAILSSSTISQGQTLGYSGSGFTPNGQVQVVIWNDGTGFIVGTPTASNSGTFGGSFFVGNNILPGQRRVTFTDTSTNYVVTNYVQVLELTVTLTQSTTTTTTSITSTATSTTSTYLTSTTTTSTSISTSTVGQVCTSTSTTQTTSVIIQATTMTSSTTSTSVTTTSSTSTFLTTTSSTRTSTSVTTTTTTVTVCTQTTTSATTSTTLTTFTRPSTSIALAVTPSSVIVGSSVILSGSISPNPAAVVVTISLSRDSGTTWVMLLSVMTDGTGAYSTGWRPPVPGSYLLEASWSGNNQLASSQSTSASLTVTGSVQLTPTVLLSAPGTTPHGQTVTLSVTVFNPANSALNANVTIEITGPNNYVLFDVIQVKVGANSQSTSYYDWAIPTQTGAYTVMLSLLLPTPSGIDLETVQVT